MSESRPGRAQTGLVVVLAVVIALILVPALVANLTADERSWTDWAGLAFLVAALALLPLGVMRVLRQRRGP